MRTHGFAYSSPRALLASQDSAALNKSLRAEIQQAYDAANAASPSCTTASGLSNTISMVRAEKEAAFVQAHKAVLDEHLKRMKSQSGG
jgi:hypothetical protein